MSVTRPVIRPVIPPVVDPRAGGLPWEAGGGGAPKTGSGIKSFAAGSYYETATGSGSAGSTSMSVAVLFRVASVPVAEQTLFTRMESTTATRGWLMRVTAAAAITWGFRDGTSFKSAPTHTIVAGDVGDLFLAVGTYNGTLGELYVQGVRKGSGVSASGYTAPNASDSCAIGIRGVAHTNPATVTTILGVVSSSTVVLDQAAVTAYYAAVQGAVDIQPFASGTEFLWSVKQGALTVPATWDDQIAGLDMTKAGSGLVLESGIPAVWA